jgi:hypothetical protein
VGVEERETVNRYQLLLLAAGCPDKKQATTTLAQEEIRERSVLAGLGEEFCLSAVMQLSLVLFFNFT